MKSYYMKISYDGSLFQGYATQTHHKTVQDELEKILTLLNGGEFVRTFASSRTDSGVHAFCQMVQFDLKQNYQLEELKNKINKMTKNRIVVNDLQYLKNGSNVRYDVINKTYTYIIAKDRNPFLINYSWYNSKKINIEKMIEASQYLIGEHDFTSFCSSRTKAENKIRTIYNINIEEKKHLNTNVIFFNITGNGFLYNMVRIIVGTLFNVGIGNIKPEDIKNILNEKKRGIHTYTAPPQGLYLKNIKYKEEFYE